MYQERYENGLRQMTGYYTPCKSQYRINLSEDFIINQRMVWELEKEIQRIDRGFEFVSGDSNNAEKLVEWARKTVSRIEKLEGVAKENQTIVGQLTLITECQAQLAHYDDLLKKKEQEIAEKETYFGEKSQEIHRRENELNCKEIEINEKNEEINRIYVALSRVEVLKNSIQSTVPMYDQEVQTEFAVAGKAETTDENLAQVNADRLDLNATTEQLYVIHKQLSMQRKILNQQQDKLSKDKDKFVGLLQTVETKGEQLILKEKELLKLEETLAIKEEALRY